MATAAISPAPPLNTALNSSVPSPLARWRYAPPIMSASGQAATRPNPSTYSAAGM